MPWFELQGLGARLGATAQRDDVHLCLRAQIFCTVSTFSLPALAEGGRRMLASCADVFMICIFTSVVLFIDVYMCFQVSCTYHIDLFELHSYTCYFCIDRTVLKQFCIEATSDKLQYTDRERTQRVRTVLACFSALHGSGAFGVKAVNSLTDGY